MITETKPMLASTQNSRMAASPVADSNATCRVTPCALYELARADLDSVMESCPGMSEALDEAARVRRIELREGGAKLDEEPSDA